MSKKKLNLRFPVIEYDSVKKEFIWETVKSRRITKDILSSALSLLNLISEISDVDVEDLLKTGRERRFVYGRNIFIALMRKRYPEISYSDIGSFFEGETLNLSKDHASVIHGRRTHHQLLKKKIWYKERSQKIRLTWEQGWLTDEEIGSQKFSMDELRSILEGNGIEFFGAKNIPTSEEKEDLRFKPKEIRNLLRGNGVMNPLITKGMLPSRFLYEPKGLETVT